MTLSRHFAALAVFLILAPLSQALALDAGRPSALSTGSVAAKNSVVISAKISSYIKKINADVGDKVEKGQVLINLDAAEFEANRAMAHARLDQARAALRLASSNFARMEALLEKGSATQSAFDNALFELDKARANEAMAEVELAKAETYLGYTTLSSPISGSVDYKKGEIGELTAPGQPLMKITDTVNLRFETTVKESDINLVKPGQKVDITIDALGGKKVTGKVAHIVPSGDRDSHSFVVRIDLPPTDGLRIGMYGKVRW